MVMATGRRSSIQWAELCVGARYEQGRSHRSRAGDTVRAWGERWWPVAANPAGGDEAAGLGGGSGEE